MSSVLSLPMSSVPPAVDSAPAPAAAGGAPDQSFMFPTLGLSALSRNPQLPQHPLGAYTDSLYEAQVAQLRNDIMSQYNDVLQQLGYSDGNGNFVPGQVEIDANRQRSELGRNTQLADEATTQQAQREGTLFSGLRGTAQARAEYPFQSGIADLNVSVPKQLTDLYGHATGLINQFNTQHNLLLADAAQRAAANLQNNAAAGGANVTGVAAPPTDASGAPTPYAAPQPPSLAGLGGYVPTGSPSQWQPQAGGTSDANFFVQPTGLPSLPPSPGSAPRPGLPVTV